MQKLFRSPRLINPLALLMTGVVLMTFSCTSEHPADGDDQLDVTETDGANDGEQPDKPAEVFYMLPSVLQIAHIFRKSGLKYYPNISNDVRNMSLYVSETSKMQNMGVYSADLCWAALNKQTQEELTYLNAMMKLSNDLGMGSVFSSTAFVDRFERNVGIEDSMIVILSELQERMDFYLQEADMDYKSTVIFSGAWIESVYISLSAYRLEGKESGLSMTIQEQVYILEGLISKLEAVWEPDDELKLLISDLNALHFLINGFAAMKKVDKEEQVLVKEVPITDLEIDMLMNKVEEIRKRITNNE